MTGREKGRGIERECNAIVRHLQPSPRDTPTDPACVQPATEYRVYGGKPRPEPHFASMKTNAARVLDRLGIAYELREYAVDPEDLSAEKVARQVGLPPGQVFKTLVARGDRRGVLLAVVAADAELDLKALARLTGDRRVELVPLKEVQPLTGYIRGGVTALAGKKDYPVFVDAQAEAAEIISVSAGVRGTQILLAPQDYIRATKATVARIVRASEILDGS